MSLLTRKISCNLYLSKFNAYRNSKVDHKAARAFNDVDIFVTFTIPDEPLQRFILNLKLGGNMQGQLNRVMSWA